MYHSLHSVEDLKRGATKGAARLVIDLNALATNYEFLARRAGPARCGAVVKANAYGLGAARTAATLADRGCRQFFVAHLAEGIELRPHLPFDASIYVLNGLQRGTEPTCAAAGLIPVLNSLNHCHAWVKLSQHLSRRLPAAIQLDTGMSRLGIMPEDVRALSEDEAFRAGVALKLVMTHLACADEPNEPANLQQHRRFVQLAALFPGIPRSIANSGGILLPPMFHLEVVRAGLALYGADPTLVSAHPMKSVVTLDAPVIQVRTVPKNAGVGYGLTFKTGRRTRIATIGIGYADGWPRSLGDRGGAWFKGVRLPMVGRVSMDSVTLDVSGLAEGAIGYGDRVELIGPRQTLETVAAEAGTIAYEILTRLGNRFERIHLDTAAVSKVGDTGE